MALGDWVGGNGNTWYRGQGISRQEVKGPCLLRNDGAFFLLKRNKLGNVIGIPYVKNKEFRWGKVILGQDENGNQTNKLVLFQETSTAQESNWNACNFNRPIDQRTNATDPTPEPNPEPDFNPWQPNSTPITENIDWRIALAVAIVVIIGIYAATKLR